MQSHIEVPESALSRDAIEGLVDEFITREGTDYGVREYSLEEKRASVLRQLARREIAIVFDLSAESTTLVPREELLRLGIRDDEDG